MALIGYRSRALIGERVPLIRICFENLFKLVSLGSLCGISYMEFYYENKLLSESLPEGYYKNMYGSFTPMKLTLSPQEVKKYWDENPKEFHWARDEIFQGTTRAT